MDKIVHFEIPFDDKKRAMTFYSDVFGWKLTDMAEMSYVMAETVAVDDQADAERAGCNQRRPFPAPEEAPHPVIYAGVESVEQALKKVQAAGGKVVTPKTPIPGMGAFARVSDPEGNVIGLFEGM